MVVVRWWEKVGGKVFGVMWFWPLQRTVIALLVVVRAGLARLRVLHRMSGRLEDLGRRCVVTQPGDEDRAQRLGRNLLAVVALEEALDPAGPRRALHRAVEARLRWVEEVGRVATHLEREELRILVEDRREL